MKKSLSVFVSVAILSLAPAASAQSLPDPQRWIRHVNVDLLPFWEHPDALGSPVGNFPSMRCNDGAAFDAQAPCDEIASIPWLRAEQQHIVAQARQTYAYGVAFHLTGETRFLDYAEAGAKHLLEHGLDPANGLFYSTLTGENRAGSSDLTKRTSQQQAYGLLGLSFLYYLTRRDDLRDVIVDLHRTLREQHFAEPEGYYRLPGDTDISLASQLDHLNAYMFLMARLLPKTDQDAWLVEMVRIAELLKDQFYSTEQGMFSNLRDVDDLEDWQTRYDFGHTIKSFWFVRMVGDLAGRADLVKWAEQNGRNVLNRAYIPETGAWATGYQNDGELDASSTSWIHAELDQFAASLSIQSPDLHMRLASTTEYWFSSFVDPIHAGIWDKLDGRTSKPGPTPPKHWPWKAGYHSFEHALVGYITSAKATSEPVQLYFAIDHDRDSNLFPYYFKAATTNVSTDTLADGRRRQTVVFENITW